MKQPFDPDIAFPRIEAAIAPFPKAGLSLLMDEGHTTAFEQLVACIISIRTLDEIMLPVARRLFEAAPTPHAISELSPETIETLIYGCGFHKGKAKQIHAIAQQVVNEYDGVLPCDLNVLLSLHGVGPKCAHLVLSIACGQEYIGVDTHVHRISNRWGYVVGKTPEKTLAALEAKLPRKHWNAINRLLVPFGKNICTPIGPKCPACPVLEMCQQVGVKERPSAK
ncbi:MAG: endonuclease III [Abitibacteriaceae bacterium]|nr:endonuclease III [Abditibacteriaceae bacterium]